MGEPGKADRNVMEVHLSFDIPDVNPKTHSLKEAFKKGERRALEAFAWFLYDKGFRRSDEPKQIMASRRIYDGLVGIGKKISYIFDVYDPGNILKRWQEFFESAYIAA